MSNKVMIVDGEEYRACPRCVRIGYGQDAYHPMTTEFWPMSKGSISFARCKACTGEVMVRKLGMVQ